MEILIFGVILVALMVFASTKIKKSAARAFEQEAIETEDFKITKPEGFINPINEDSAVAFEAYTKELGENDAKNFRQAQANLRIVSDSDFETVCENAKASADKILSENWSENPRVYLLESERIEQDVPIISSWKIVENIQKRKVYELQISVIEAYREDYTARENKMINSFVVK
ncbi:MAG: hypothetical protein M3388_13685 [Acidobacteriota bacterium]|nr:hypothetical protein [Acidobacteriota bacterium]